MDLIVADEFRDGNVPAHSALLPITKRAFQSLDSACWERELLNRLRDERRAERAITLAVSVRMTRGLKKHILRLPDNLGRPYRSDSQTEAECADVLSYWPEEEERPKGAGPLRYTAIRIRKRQGALFADGDEVKYFAVASNQWKWDAKKLLGVLVHMAPSANSGKRSDDRCVQRCWILNGTSLNSTPSTPSFQLNGHG